MHLPDVNFWLALTFITHPSHPSAKTWFDSSNYPICYFCRHTQQAFLRLANDPRVMQAQAVHMVEAWRLYDLALTDSRVEFVDEPPGLETAWRAHTQRRQFSPKLWADAYLAAFAQATGFEVVTFDQGFKQFPNLKLTILK
jgi:hypothetical protein